MSGYAIRTNERGGVDFVDGQSRGRKGQPANRDYEVYEDQFGRMWGGPIEKRSLAPVNIRPLFQVNHPILEPPAKFVQHAPKGDRRRVWIDLEGWERECRAGWQEREENKRKFATALYGNAAGEAMKNPPQELLAMLGPEPLLKPEVVQAMRAGNKWALSLENGEPPAAAREFIPDERTLRGAATRAPVLPDAADPFAGGAPASEPEPTEDDEDEVEYPVSLGFGNWKFSDGSEAKVGKRPAAERHEKQIREGTLEPSLDSLAR